MKHSSFIKITALLQLFIIVGSCSKDEPNPSVTLPGIDKYNSHTRTELIRDIKEYLQIVRSNGYSGIVGLIVEDEDELIFPMGEASPTNQTKNNTIFPIGSLTKGFIGAAATLAEEQDLLVLDDPISRYFENVPVDKQLITIHHLLTHTAGFPTVIGSDEELIDRDGYIISALQTNLSTSPGSQFAYSNVGYSLVAAIIEIVTEKPHMEYLQERVFDDAGIEVVDYSLSESELSLLAHGHDLGSLWGTHYDLPRLSDGPGWNLRGNGGLFATVHDIFLWKKAMENKLIFSSETYKKVTTPYVEQGNGSTLYYGYGWDVGVTSRGTRVLNHDGGNGVYYARITWWSDEGIFLFTASNNNNQPFEQLPSNLNTMIIRYLNN